MTGPKPSGPTHPGPTHPPRDLDDIEQHHYGIGEPNEYSTPPLPRLGEKVRDAERLAVQLIRVLDREVDPASEPDVLAWPAVTDAILAHDLLLARAALQVKDTLRCLQKVASMPLPPVGSAVKLPARPGAASSVTPVAEDHPGGPPAPGVGAERPPLGVLGPQ